MAKVTGSLQKSTEIMKLSNQLVKLPQISQAMREMSMEMTKVYFPLPPCLRSHTHRYPQAGILEEMMDDTLAVEEDEEIEAEADEEVDKVLFDLTNGKLGLAGSAPAAPVSGSVDYLRSNGSHFFQSKPRRRNWKTRRQSVSWSNIVSSSVVFSAHDAFVHNLYLLSLLCIPLLLIRVLSGSSSCILILSEFRAVGLLRPLCNLGPVRIPGFLPGTLTAQIPHALRRYRRTSSIFHCFLLAVYEE